MAVLDISQLAMLLELEPPFGPDEVQLARRKLAKRWHPDIAPPGKRQAHEDHLKAINEAADQLESLLAGMPKNRITKAAAAASADAARRERAQAGRRAWEHEQARRRAQADREQHDPFRAQTPDHSVVYRYARCNAYPEWGVGSILGIYFLGEGDDVQQWARVSFEVGVRTVPAGTLDFVDFSKPDSAKERARRFLLSAEHAMMEGDYELAAQRLVYARDADEDDPTIHRLMTVAFWQAGDLDVAARAVRAWARVEPGRPAPHRYASRLYGERGLLELAAESAERECAADPRDARAWARLGELRLRLLQAEPAHEALTRARRLPGAGVETLLNLALANHLLGQGNASAECARTAVRMEPESAAAWTALAHALDRTGARSECLDACERAIALGADQDEIGAIVLRRRREDPQSIESAA